MNSKVAGARSYHHGNLKAALLDAAEQELSEKGLNAFSLRNVARRADVSHNAPAHHLTDARGLLTALAAVGFQRLVAMQHEQMKSASVDDANQFLALGLGYIEFATDYPALFGLMYSSKIPDRKNSELASSMKAALDLLTRSAPVPNPAATDASSSSMENTIAAWAMVHGYAELINSGQMTGFLIATNSTQTELAKSILARLKIR